MIGDFDGSEFARVLSEAYETIPLFQNTPPSVRQRTGPSSTASTLYPIDCPPTNPFSISYRPATVHSAPVSNPPATNPFDHPLPVSSAATMCSRAGSLLLIGVKQEEGFSNEETLLEPCKVVLRVPTGDLNGATCLSIPTKVPDTTSPRAAETSVMQHSKEEEPTGVEPTHHLEGDRKLALCKYTCEVCGKAFANIGRLNRHVNVVHKNLRKFPCDICGHSFQRNGDLNRHINTVHKNLRNFPCSICGHSFKEKGALKMHVDTLHKNLRNFPCDICGRSFTRKKTLQSHVNTVHKNLRNFPCDICGYSFKWREYLRTHVNNVHKNLRNFPCEICSRCFKGGGSLKKHINGVHKKLQPFSCAICGRLFTQKSSLKTHIQRLHPAEKQEKPEIPS